MPFPVFTPPKQPSVSDYSPGQKAAVNTVGYEGGYTQRARLGPNHIQTRVPLSFRHLTIQERDDLRAFFDARGGVEAFTFQLPTETQPRVWTAEEWNYPPESYKTRWRFKTTLIEQFDIQ